MALGNFFLDISKEALKGGVTAGLGLLAGYCYNCYKDRRIEREIRKSLVGSNSFSWSGREQSAGFVVRNETPWPITIHRVWVSLRDFSPQEFSLNYAGAKEVPPGELATLNPFTSAPWRTTLLKTDNATKIKGVHVRLEYKSLLGTSKLLQVDFGEEQSTLIRNSLLMHLQQPPEGTPTLEDLLPPGFSVDPSPQPVRRTDFR